MNIIVSALMASAFASFELVFGLAYMLSFGYFPIESPVIIQAITTLSVSAILIAASFIFRN